jgi:pimeloyl-ACP methyl ester carboxylesterase
MLRFDEQEALRRIPVPVLVVGGVNDKLTELRASEHIEGLLPHGLPARMDPAGHIGFWEQHEEFAEVLAEFAERYAGGKTSRPADSKRQREAVE